jgi:hypothetical protein
MHTIARTASEIRHLGFTTGDHPLYSSDLAQSDFHFFPKLKKNLREQHQASNVDVTTAVKLWFRHQDES